MIVEIRTYRLVPGTAAEFVRVMRDESLPLLRAAGIRVLDLGLSLGAEDGHRDAFLIRAFESLDEHERQEADFYAGDAWRSGPRESIVSRIVSYHSVTIEASPAAVAALSRTVGPDCEGDA